MDDLARANAMSIEIDECIDPDLSYSSLASKGLA